LWFISLILSSFYTLAGFLLSIIGGSTESCFFTGLSILVQSSTRSMVSKITISKVKSSLYVFLRNLLC